MKKAIGLLLALVMAMALTGCEDKAALDFGEGMAMSMRDNSMTFTFSMCYSKTDTFTDYIVGTGTATGLLSGDTRVQAECGTRSIQTLVINFGGFSSSKRMSSEYYHLNLHYRDGTLYLADKEVGSKEHSPLLPPPQDDGVDRLVLPAALRDALGSAGIPPGVIGDIRIAPQGAGKQMNCTIAPDSDLGRTVCELVAFLDMGVDGSSGEVSRVEAIVLSNEDGSFREMDLVVERTTLSRTYERVLTVKATGYGPVEAIRFPEYVQSAA